MSRSAALTQDASDQEASEKMSDRSDDDRPTFFERILPNSALARWAIYLVIVAGFAALLWYVVFPKLQNLLPEGF